MNPPSTTVHDHVQDNALPDHRRIGRQLGVFATDESLGAGLPLWLPAGMNSPDLSTWRSFTWTAGGTVSISSSSSVPRWAARK